MRKLCATNLVISKRSVFIVLAYWSYMYEIPIVSIIANFPRIFRSLNLGYRRAADPTNISIRISRWKLSLACNLDQVGVDIIMRFHRMY